MLVSRAFAFVFNWYKEIIAPSLPFSSGALQHTAHSSIIKAKIVSLKFFSSANLGLAPKKTAIPIRSVQNADCRPGTKCRLRIYAVLFILRLIRDNMSSYNSPSVTLSLFRDHLPRIILWNIPCPFLDQNRS